MLLYMFLEIPSAGPAITKTCVIPSNGINTNKALAAFLYCWDSTLVAERSFVINTFNDNVKTNCYFKFNRLNFVIFAFCLLTYIITIRNITFITSTNIVGT